jgi:hypothetical protein
MTARVTGRGHVWARERTIGPSALTYQRLVRGRHQTRPKLAWRERVRHEKVETRSSTPNRAASDSGSGNGVPGQIIIECDACGEEFRLSEDCALVVTSAEVILFKVVHDGHGAVDIAVRASG